MKGLAEKYVTKRQDAGGIRWYWQKKGSPLVRLPDDPAERAAMATQLNLEQPPAPTIRFDYWYGFWKSARNRARSRGIPFNLTYDQLAELAKRAKGKCAISGAKFQTDNDGRVGIGNPFQPSIDRIDPNKGYTDGNCRLVCLAVNVGVNKVVS